MEVIVQAKKLSVTKALRGFIKVQAQKLSKLNTRASKVLVYLEHVARKTSDPQRALAKFKVEMPGKNIVVKKKAVNLYDAVVDAANGVARQARRLKEKRIEKKRIKLFSK